MRGSVVGREIQFNECKCDCWARIPSGNILRRKWIGYLLTRILDNKCRSGHDIAGIESIVPSALVLERRDVLVDLNKTLCTDLQVPPSCNRSQPR